MRSVHVIHGVQMVMAHPERLKKFTHLLVPARLAPMALEAGKGGLRTVGFAAPGRKSHRPHKTRASYRRWRADLKSYLVSTDALTMSAQFLPIYMVH